jgi:hypothetical protein
VASAALCVLLPFVLPDGQGPPRPLWLIALPVVFGRARILAARVRTPRAHAHPVAHGVAICCAMLALSAACAALDARRTEPVPDTGAPVLHHDAAR